MKLVGVTITGADNRTPVPALREFGEYFPFVEWGILLSSDKGSGNGNPRYPVQAWMKLLSEQNLDNKIKFSGHLCGKWARQCLKGNFGFVNELNGLDSMFHRIQFNISPYLMTADDKFIDGMINYSAKRPCQFIVGTTQVDHPFVLKARFKKLDIVPLYDPSGGTGLLNENWPKNNHFLTGYAGGLNPDNLEYQLTKLSEVVSKDHPVWIDVESGVRTKDFFDLSKVVKFLEIAATFISKG